MSEKTQHSTSTVPIAHGRRAQSRIRIVQSSQQQQQQRGAAGDGDIGAYRPSASRHRPSSRSTAGVGHFHHNQKDFAMSAVVVVFSFVVRCNYKSFQNTTDHSLAVFNRRRCSSMIAQVVAVASWRAGPTDRTLIESLCRPPPQTQQDVPSHAPGRFGRRPVRPRPLSTRARPLLVRSVSKAAFICISQVTS